MSELNPVPFVSVIIPAFQEQDTIQESLNRLYSQLEAENITHELILVSDGSTDQTAQRALELKIPTLEVLHYPENMGKGHAIQHGYEHSTGEFVAFFDADLDLHPRSLTRAYRYLANSDRDVVIGSKVHPQSIVRYPIARRVQSRVYRSLTKLLFGLGVTDTQTGCKVFKRSALNGTLEAIDTSGFAFDLDLLVNLSDNGYRISESPVDLDYHFSSSMPFTAAVPILRDTLMIAFRRRFSKSNSQLPPSQR